MTKQQAPKSHRLKDWRERRAARRALRGDTPEKLNERRRPDEQPSVRDNANRAGMGGFFSGGF